MKKIILVVIFYVLVSMMQGPCSALPIKYSNKKWEFLKTAGFHPPTFSAAGKYQRPGKFGFTTGEVESLAIRNGLINGTVLSDRVLENIFYPGVVWEFDVTTVTWSMLHNGSGASPSPRAFAAVDFGGSAAGNVLILFGGVHVSADETGNANFPIVFFNDVWKFFFSNFTWVQMFPSGSGPSERVSGGHGIVGDGFYLFSGIGSLGTDNAVYLYNITTNAWSVVSTNDPNDPNKPANRSQVACQIQPGTGKLVIVGGESLVINPPGSEEPFGQITLRDVWSFDTATATWTLLNNGSDFPVPSPSHFAMAFENEHSFWIQNGDRQGNTTAEQTCSASALSGYPSPGERVCDHAIVPSDETFEFDMKKKTWKHIVLRTNLPATRRSEMWFDEEAEAFFFAGGYGWDGVHEHFQEEFIDGTMTDILVAIAEIPQPYTWACYV